MRSTARSPRTRRPSATGRSAVDAGQSYPSRAGCGGRRTTNAAAASFSTSCAGSGLPVRRPRWALKSSVIGSTPVELERPRSDGDGRPGCSPSPRMGSTVTDHRAASSSGTSVHGCSTRICAKKSSRPGRDVLTNGLSDRETQIDLVIGAGPAGLAHAFWQTQLDDPQLDVRRSSTHSPGTWRLGSKTRRIEGYVCEQGPQGLRPTEVSDTFIAALGLTDDVVACGSQRRSSASSLAMERCIALPMRDRRTSSSTDIFSLKRKARRCSSSPFGVEARSTAEPRELGGIRKAGDSVRQDRALSPRR